MKLKIENESIPSRGEGNHIFFPSLFLWTMLTRVHIRHAVRSFVARRSCVRTFSGQNNEVEEEKEGPYNAETYRKRMHESGKFVDAAEKKTSTVIQTKQHESTTRTHTHTHKIQ